MLGTLGARVFRVVSPQTQGVPRDEKPRFNAPLIELLLELLLDFRGTFCERLNFTRSKISKRTQRFEQRNEAWASFTAATPI